MVWGSFLLIAAAALKTPTRKWLQRPRRQPRIKEFSIQSIIFFDVCLYGICKTDLRQDATTYVAFVDCGAVRIRFFRTPFDSQ